MKVFVDVAGYNFSIQSLEEVIEFYKLNPIQVYLLKQGKGITIREDVFLEIIFNAE